MNNTRFKTFTFVMLLGFFYMVMRTYCERFGDWNRMVFLMSYKRGVDLIVNQGAYLFLVQVVFMIEDSVSSVVLKYKDTHLNFFLIIKKMKEGCKVWYVKKIMWSRLAFFSIFLQQVQVAKGQDSFTFITFSVHKIINLKLVMIK